MKTYKFLTLIMMVTLTLFMLSSCEKTESFDPAQVQTLLESNTPMELFEGGIPLDSLYGKMYLSGLIFHLNTTDGTGMVAATDDQSTGAKWGCFGIDIVGLNNVDNDPTEPETEEGARIGDGAANTTAILDMTNGCNEDGIAAKLCRDIGQDWFLPSRGELDLMYVNLHENGHGGFVADFYWSSTEYVGNSGWTMKFDDGRHSDDFKSFMKHVRAARSF